jgi:hypothetical protein
MVLPLTCLADQLLLAIRGHPDSRGPRVGELSITVHPAPQPRAVDRSHRTTRPHRPPLQGPPRPPGRAPHTDHGGRGKLALLSTSHPRGASAAGFT